MSILSHRELLKREFAEPQFLIDPYIPRHGIIFLWGDTSIGKSPLTWAMARSVASGTSFFGLPTSQGRVLYIEVDTPAVQAVRRIQTLRPIGGEDGWMENLNWIFDEGFTIPPMTNLQNETIKRLQLLRREYDPDLVIFNTLRKLHQMKDTDSSTPAVIYPTLRACFPTSSVLLVHHEKKQAADPAQRGREDESFSGSKAWINDAQVGLRLASFGTKDNRANLKLIHAKTQVSEKMKRLELLLEADGSNMSCHTFNEFSLVYHKMHEMADIPRTELDREIGTALSLSPSTVKRRRLDIESGRWPNTREWLGRVDRVKVGEVEDE